jgi:hypothetical protein
MNAHAARGRRLDACGMEPVTLALDALAALAPGEQLWMLVEREPFSLYRILSNRGYAYCTNCLPDALYEVTIWPCGAALTPDAPPGPAPRWRRAAALRARPGAPAGPR